LVFCSQRQYDKTLEWYRRALAGKEKALVVDHRKTVIMVLVWQWHSTIKDSMTKRWSGMGEHWLEEELRGGYRKTPDYERPQFYSGWEVLALIWLLPSLKFCSRVLSLN